MNKRPPLFGIAWEQGGCFLAGYMCMFWPVVMGLPLQPCYAPYWVWGALRPPGPWWWPAPGPAAMPARMGGRADAAADDTNAGAMSWGGVAARAGGGQVLNWRVSPVVAPVGPLGPIGTTRAEIVGPDVPDPLLEGPGLPGTPITPTSPGTAGDPIPG